MAWTPYLELSLEVPPLKCLDCLFEWRGYADKMICWSRQKRASRSVRSEEEKHIDFDLSTGEDQDLNFNVTTGGAQDEAELLSKKYAWSSESTKIERSWSVRKNFPRSLSCQQQIPETINSSRADFFLDTNRPFRSKWLECFFQKPSNEFGCTRKRVQSSGACNKPVPVISCNFHF